MFTIRIELIFDLNFFELLGQRIRNGQSQMLSGQFGSEQAVGRVCCLSKICLIKKEARSKNK